MRTQSTRLAMLFASMAIISGLACSGDSTGPATIDAPTGVSVAMASPTSVRVSWSASAQADLIASYNIYRNGTKVGQSTSTSYVDEGLAEATQYKYAVSANGKDGQVSALSAETASATITLADVTPPRVVSNQPAASAVGVSRAATITATFSEPMNPASINATTFLVRTSGGAAIAGTIAYTAATRTAEFTPSAALPNASGITVTITAVVSDLAGNSLGNAFVFSFTVRDEVAPRVESVSPANLATGISTGTAVAIVFSKAIDPATLTASSFTLRQSSNGSLVAATIAYDASSRTATLTPSAALAASTAYSVAVSTSVKDAAGNALESAFASSFTTAAGAPPPDTDPPTVTSSVPANGAQNVAVTSPVRVTFSEAMTAATINGSSFTLTVSGAQVAGSVSYDASTRTAAFAPSAGLLAEGQSYTATITTAVKDAAGNSLAGNYIFSFTTIAPADNTPPTIVSRNPSPGATGVATSTTIAIGFSEAMNSSTINTSTLTLTVGGSPVSGSVSYDSNTRVATFTPNAALANGATYTVTVATGVRDAAGNALVVSDVFTFKTAQTNISGLYGAETWWQTTTRDGAPQGSSNPDSASVHIHFVFAQNGDALSLNAECSGGFNDRCITLARNVAGQTAIGDNTSPYVWVLLTNLTGTLNGTQISFTATNANGKTFTFTGTLTSPTSMSGTISGPTIPTEQVTFTRPPNPPP